MKRKGLLIAFLILLALILVLAGRREILTATGQTIVREPAYDLITGLGDTSFWSGFLGEVPHSVLNIAPGRFVVSLPGSKPSLLLVNVSQVGRDSSLVTWVRKLTAPGWIEEKFSQEGPVQLALKKLKTYAEDPGKRYGFPMQMVPVTTRFFLTVRDSIAQSPGSVLLHLDSVLNNYAAAHQLHFDNPAWFVSQLALANGETRLAMARSLPQPVRAEGPVTCMQLPGNGRLLQVGFNGDLKNFSRCETAAAQYILSQHLKTVAQPIQQYDRLPVTAADSSSVSMKYFLPVY